MGIDTEKVFGYFLFSIGLICIAFAFYSTYSVFTDAAKPPEIFQLKSLAFSVNPGEGKAQMEVAVSLDPEARKVANIFLYYIFMLFILAMGSKIASLGIQFIREIKVAMKKEV